MPYKSIRSLPKGVKDNLSPHAQKVYMAAYNNVWKEYANPHKRRGRSSHEGVARRVAWAAVKKDYIKDAETGKRRKK